MMDVLKESAEEVLETEDLENFLWDAACIMMEKRTYEEALKFIQDGCPAIFSKSMMFG